MSQTEHHRYILRRSSAAFIGDIAFLFGIVLIAAGLFTLHRAATDPRPLLLKMAGILLLVAGIGTALCAGYYFVKYQRGGHLEQPYPIHAMSIMKAGEQNMHMMRMMNRDRRVDETTAPAMLRGNTKHHPD